MAARCQALLGGALRQPHVRLDPSPALRQLAEWGAAERSLRGPEPGSGGGQPGGGSEPQALFAAAPLGRAVAALREVWRGLGELDCGAGAGPALPAASRPAELARPELDRVAGEAAPSPPAGPATAGEAAVAPDEAHIVAPAEPEAAALLAEAAPAKPEPPAAPAAQAPGAVLPATPWHPRHPADLPPNKAAAAPARAEPAAVVLPAAPVTPPAPVPSATRGAAAGGAAALGRPAAVSVERVVPQGSSGADSQRGLLGRLLKPGA